MKVDLGLQVAANAFIDALTPIVQSVDKADGENRKEAAIRNEITVEAFDLACAFIDVDRRATDEELWALIVAFAPVLDPDLINKSPDDLRSSGLIEGKRQVLDRPSRTFARLLDHDVREDTSWSTIYYEHAVALAFMVASLDDHTDRAELIAIERFRGMLLEPIKTGKIPEPNATQSPPDNPVPTGSTRASGASHEEPATAVAAHALTDQSKADEPLPPPRPLDELLAELDKLVGLKAVKDEIKLVTNLLRIQKLRRDRGLKTMDQSRHLVFTGNPGTGKTTVARLLAQIYRTLGVVERGQLVETDRAGLVAGFVGQTATKVVDAFDRADQGVLLIDEAYALIRGSDSDFGKEAIDTIVKLVEDRRYRIVVIVAGYPDEMHDFVDANPGLRSRFPKTIQFPDYSTDELVQIFQGMCDQEHYLLDADAKQKVKLLIASQPRIKGFGNGRLARNLFEQSVANHASRVVDIKSPTDVHLVTMLRPDIPDVPPLPNASADSPVPGIGSATP